MLNKIEDLELERNYFPLLIEYENGDIVEVCEPEQIRNGIGFKVIFTNYSCANA